MGKPLNPVFQTETPEFHEKKWSRLIYEPDLLLAHPDLERKSAPPLKSHTRFENKISFPLNSVVFHGKS